MKTWDISAWASPQARHPERSVDFTVRLALAAVILGLHPIFALLHREEIGHLADALEAQGLPLAVPLAWTVTCALLLFAACLAARRFVAEACIGAIFVLGVGAVLLYAPRWYVAGGEAEDGHPGVEFNVLLCACLFGVLRRYWPRDAGEGAEDEEHAAAQALEVLPRRPCPLPPPASGVRLRTLGRGGECASGGRG